MQMQQIKNIPNAMLSQLTANYIEDPDDLSSPCLFTNREKGYASSQVSTLHQHGSSNRHRNNILAVLFFSFYRCENRGWADERLVQDPRTRKGGVGFEPGTLALTTPAVCPEGERPA